MVIAKKPNSNKSEIAPSTSEKVAEAFISGAGKADAKKKKERKKPFLMRLDDEMRDRIDRAASKSGNSSAAWLRNAISRALHEEENKP